MFWMDLNLEQQQAIQAQLRDLPKDAEESDFPEEIQRLLRWAASVSEEKFAELDRRKNSATKTADRMLLMGTAPGEQVYLILDGPRSGQGISVRDDGSVVEVPSWGYMTKIVQFAEIQTPTHAAMWQAAPDMLELTKAQLKQVEHLLIDVVEPRTPSPKPVSKDERDVELGVDG
jgi:hypothetical protein